jgi:hypothetical protein
VSWVKLDDQWCDHPKFVSLPDLAQLLWVKALTYACRYRTKGLVPAGALAKMLSIRNTKQLEAKLVSAGLWIGDGQGGYTIHDFAKYQLVSDKTSEARSAAGKKGAAVTWQKPPPEDGNCHPVANSKTIAESEPRADARRALGSGSGSGMEEDPEVKEETVTPREEPESAITSEVSGPDPIQVAIHLKIREYDLFRPLEAKRIAKETFSWFVGKGWALRKDTPKKLAAVLESIDSCAAKTSSGLAVEVLHRTLVSYIRNTRDPADAVKDAPAKPQYREDAPESWERDRDTALSPAESEKRARDAMASLTGKLGRGAA